VQKPQPQMKLQEILAIKDLSERLHAYQGYERMLLGEIYLYGVSDDPSVIPFLQRLYNAAVLNTEPETRTRVYDAISEAVIEQGLSPNALLPFVTGEQHGLLASRAVIDFCMAAAQRSGKAEAGMMEVAGLLRAKVPANTGAVFGGLLCLGDRRAHGGLLSVRDLLEPEEVDQAVRIRTGFLSAATIEFYLDWMEERLQVSDERIFGALAAGMHNQITAARVPAVLTGQRAIPPGVLPPDVEEKQEAWVPLSAYAQQIAPRLLALHEAETEPKLMPEVLEAWGVMDQG
jgi:hypothetical protein